MKYPKLSYGGKSMKRIAALLVTLCISGAIYGYSVKMSDGEMSRDYRYIYRYLHTDKLPSKTLPSFPADSIGDNYMNMNWTEGDYTKGLRGHYDIYLYTDDIIKSSDWELFLQ
jgi:hypothetical protein